MKYVNQVVQALLDAEAHTATKFVSEKLTIRATRRLLRGRIDRRNKSIDISLTISRPNYRARKFIKDCVKAGVTFPVRRIQLKYPPRRKK